ncbi:hypothetical protein [Bacillus sp. AFS023182]|uniref:hypothetical protein n=1 Tax=Bacillus sp. AFS023182 TaxID=2033492 RepID=UPI000BFB2834|nr:hypothetical protein [Bacillus sp. AFS023182]
MQTEKLILKVISIGKMAEGGSRVLPPFKGYEPAGNDILVVVQRRSVSIIHKRTVHLNYLEEF